MNMLALAFDETFIFAFATSLRTVITQVDQSVIATS